jgi:hypothetical protein
MNAPVKSIHRTGIGNAFAMGKSLAVLDFGSAMRRSRNGNPTHGEFVALKGPGGMARVFLREFAGVKSS